LHKDIQKDIDLNLEFIPKSENWDRVVKIQNSKDVTLETMRSEKIESMENKKPNLYPEESFINHINYSWKVLPPIKPQNAQQSNLYLQFDEIKKNLDKNLDKLETHLNFIIKESDSLTSFVSLIRSVYNFLGTNRKAKKNLEKIKEYRGKDLHSMSIIDLNNFLNSEFKDFYQSIIKDENDFKEDKKRKEAEDIWNTEKEKREKELAKNRETLSEKESELNELNKKLSEQKRELSKKISEIQNSIKEKDNDFKTEKRSLEISEKEEKELKDLLLQIEKQKEKIDGKEQQIKKSEQQSEQQGSSK
jgi:chromosome segregation ATPase